LLAASLGFVSSFFSSSTFFCSPSFVLHKSSPFRKRNKRDVRMQI
jgi:hypothetical protein